jgi:hypothetical protein
VPGGFISFVHVDLKGKPLPPDIILKPTQQEDIDLQIKLGLWPKG